MRQESDMHDGDGQFEGGGSCDAPNSTDSPTEDRGLTPPPRDARQSLLSTLLIPLIFIFGLLTFFGAGPVVRSIQSLQYPFQLDNVEGYLLDEAVEISQGRSIYQPIDEAPYLVGNYPPVYQAAMSLFLKISEPTLFIGRLLVLSSLALIAVCLVELVSRTGGQILPALLAPFLFTVTYELHSWVAYARVDLPAIFFTLFGLVFFVAENSRMARGFALVFFAVALFTKQTAVSAPLACFLFLLGRDWKGALRFAFWMVVLVAIPTALLSAATRGEYWRHTVSYNANEMDWSKLRDFWLPHLWRFYRYYLIAIAASVVFVGVRWAGWKIRREAEEETPSGKLAYSAGDRLAVVTLYFLLSLMNVLALAKAGSAENYLLEPLAAATLLVCCVLGVSLTDSRKRGLVPLPRVMAVALIALLALHTHYVVKGDLGGYPPLVAMFSRTTPGESEWDGGMKLLQLVRRSNGEVLSEDPIFLTLAGRRPPVNPFILSQLAREGIWDQQPFLDAIARKRFSLVIATVDFFAAEHFDRYTDEMAAAFRKNYERIESVDMGRGGQTYFVYRPRQKKSRVINVVQFSPGGGATPTVIQRAREATSNSRA